LKLEEAEEAERRRRRRGEGGGGEGGGAVREGGGGGKMMYSMGEIGGGYNVRHKFFAVPNSIYCARIIN